MNESGYVYVLANSAMPGLVKVGKTTRNPAERAAELSGTTGMPTAFMVVYEQFFFNCSEAEGFVHAYLGRLGYRVSDNREFFNAPTNLVVKAVSLAPGAIEEQSLVRLPAEDDSLISTRTSDDLEDMILIEQGAVPIWLSIVEEADRHFYGIGDYIQDYQEAMKLYRQAAKLGSIAAYSKLGKMYTDGLGAKKDQAKGLEYYKEGARRGSAHCYWQMAQMFRRNSQTENASKCYCLFLSHIPELLVDDEHLTQDQLDDILSDVVLILFFHVKYGHEIPREIIDFIESQRKSVLARAEGIQRYAQENEPGVDEAHYKNLISYINGYIRRLG